MAVGTYLHQTTRELAGERTIRNGQYAHGIWGGRHSPAQFAVSPQPFTNTDEPPQDQDDVDSRIKTEVTP